MLLVDVRSKWQAPLTQELLGHWQYLNNATRPFCEVPISYDTSPMHC